MIAKCLFKVAAGALAVAGVSSNAYAACTFNNGAVLQDNHLVRYLTNLNGETQYKSTFDDPKRSGGAKSVKASPECRVNSYHASGQRNSPPAGQGGDIPADARGVGCSCVAKK